MQIVKIEWEDSCAITGWHNQGKFEDYDVSPCRTVGYLLGKDKKKITVLQSISNSPSFCEALTIPRGNVKKITYLKEDSDAKRK